MQAECAVCERVGGTSVAASCGDVRLCAHCTRRVLPQLQAYARDIGTRMSPLGWHVAYVAGADVPMLCCRKGDVVVHTRLDRAALLAIVSRRDADHVARERHAHRGAT